MEKVYHTQSDWFETKIIPAIRRRTIFAAIILALCVVAWFYYESWITLVIGALVLAERIFEFAHIPSTKKTIDSLNIAISETGLSFRGAGIKGSVLYPWPSLSFKIKNSKAGIPESITIEDKTRKGSKINLTGYEGMGELMALIEDNAGKS
ncbi:MAG: hypothetical protein ABFR65_04395 [Pseudomonadota bacterium]